MTDMRINKTMKRAVLVAGMWLGALLPSAASATPMTYDLLATSRMTVEIGGGSVGSADGVQAVTNSRSFSIRHQGARITFDSETGKVSQMRFRLGRLKTAYFATPEHFQLEEGSILSDGKPAFLRMVSTRGPQLRFSLALRHARDGGTGPQTGANPVPEPTAAMLFGAGLVAVGSATRRNRRR